MNATPAVPPPPAVGAAAGAGTAATSAAAAIARPANLQALWALLQSPGGEPPDPLDTAARAPIRHLGQLLVNHGLVSPEQVHTALQQQQLSPILPEWQFAADIIHAIYPSRRGQLPAVRAFLQHLDEFYANLSHEW